MDEMTRFLEQCFERERQGCPPVDLDAIRQGRPQPAPPVVEPAESQSGTAVPGSARTSPAARNGIGRSAVFTVRLARDDLALLERRAQLAGIPPSALARNLINLGLREGDGAGELAEAVRRVEDAAAQLRAVLP